MFICWPSLLVGGSKLASHQEPALGCRWAKKHVELLEGKNIIRGPWPLRAPSVPPLESSIGYCRLIGYETREWMVGT
jgi:hypothetical protein